MNNTVDFSSLRSTDLGFSIGETTSSLSNINPISKSVSSVATLNVISKPITSPTKSGGVLSWFKQLSNNQIAGIFIILILILAFAKRRKIRVWFDSFGHKEQFVPPTYVMKQELPEKKKEENTQDDEEKDEE